MFSSFFDELSKIAAETKPEDQGTRTMRGIVSARPWVTSAAKGALPAASLTALAPIKSEQLKRKLMAAAALVGGSAGVGDRYIREWASRHPKSAITKKLKSQLQTEKGEFKKTGAMAADLRRKGLGGVTEPPFPTEDSKQTAENQLATTQQQASFGTHTLPRHLVRPGPSINQTAAVPR